MKRISSSSLKILGMAAVFVCSIVIFESCGGQKLAQSRKCARNSAGNKRVAGFTGMAR